MLHSARNVPRLARGSRRQWFRTRSSPFPVKAGLTGSTGPHLCLIRVCVGLCVMAAYSISSCQHNSARYGERKCSERSRVRCYGIGLVRVLFPRHCDCWINIYDPQSECHEGVDRWRIKKHITIIITKPHPPLRIRPPQNKIEGKVGSEPMTKMIPHITSRTLLEKANFWIFFLLNIKSTARPGGRELWTVHHFSSYFVLSSRSCIYGWFLTSVSYSFLSFLSCEWYHLFLKAPFEDFHLFLCKLCMDVCM